MRVLHVIPSMEAEHGGPTVALEGMTKGLAARGVEVTIAATARDTRLVSSHLPCGATVLRFPRTVPGSWKYSRALGHWLRGNGSAFDVVHVHALFSYSTIPACRAAIAHRVPLVLRPLGTLDPWSLAHRRWKKRPYFRLVERKHLDRADVIHVTSELERRGVVALGYGSKARIIPLGVDHVWTTAAVREKHERAAGRAGLNILFLSRLHPKKGLPLLIAALGQLRGEIDFRLRIAGGGPPAYVGALERMCVEAGITPTVTLLGHVARDGKREQLEWSDVFVLPSSQENFSLAAVEAMAAGVPVLLSDHVAVGHDAAAAHAGLMVPTEVEAIAAALRQLAGDPGLRFRMGLAGRALVERRFTWAATADSLVDLYAELRSGKRRSSGVPA